jgi:N12 class adenine-specific DNA methylase
MNDITEHEGDLKTVQLTQREVKLLLKYGYPFEDIEAQLNAYKNRKGTHTIKISQFNIEHLIGDLVYSAKKLTNNTVLEELDAVCSVLENAEHHASRLRGI